MPHLLDLDQMKQLADVLGDSPMTVISCHYLRRGQCKAWTVGSVSDFQATVVQWDELPNEPEAYGQPDQIWQILQNVSGWSAVDVPDQAAAPLARLVAKGINMECSLYPDLYHVLRQPVRQFHSPDVRLFGRQDINLVHRSLPEELGKPAKFVDNVGWSIFAGALADAQIVAYAYASARTGGYANIGVETMSAYRNRGYCSAAASLVARAAQEAGEVPVWSAGHTNAASLRVAQKLGFELSGTKTYVVRPDWKRPQSP